MLSIKKYFLLLSIALLGSPISAQQIALLQYNGGGDWYANPTSLPNLINFSNEHINTTIAAKPITVKPGSTEIFQYPFVHMTGHGNVIFSQEEAENLRKYLLSGGFLHIDDNYGMRKYLEKELDKIFPDKTWEELTANHPIFSSFYKFPNGLPKIHEHDNKPPQAFGYYDENRLICLFTYESDLGNGWESQEVHNDPEEVRLKALKMGANILKYVFEN
ncbi:protein of unknown function [Salegentibacter echinorum]|uniref:DUF4159 domain-containing protein n=1 Tax=Salegentibacter echinorum TaxID=1073325 RepID=A0A1M5J1M5_SALEC|nr:DUF4159 domain-containing protein [Salegentibacter echinorum]SHG34130.1 protein of unknown function [Salegentibacter echinorum]